MPRASRATGSRSPISCVCPCCKKLDCPPTPELACKLSGSNLYLIDSVSADAEFAKPVVVPDGFLGSALPVPHPQAGTLYLKLRDNPQIVNPAALTVRRYRRLPAERTGPRSASPRCAPTRRGYRARAASLAAIGRPAPPCRSSV